MTAMTAGKYFSKIIFQCKCVLFFYSYLFLTVLQKVPGGMDALALLYFAKIQWLWMHDSCLWI